MNALGTVWQATGQRQGLGLAAAEPVTPDELHSADDGTVGQVDQGYKSLFVHLFSCKRRLMPWTVRKPVRYRS